MKLNIKKYLIIIFYILLWQLVASLINNSLIFASPIDCILAFKSLLFTKEFYKAIYFTTTNVLVGIGFSYLLAIIAGFVSFRFNIVKDLLNPLIKLFNSIPIAAFSILILIWYGNQFLTLFITFIVVFPQIYFAVISGLENRDERLVWMSIIDNTPLSLQILHVDRFAIAPYIISASKSCISMGIKSSIAAEIIGLTANSIGLQLYFSKLYLYTADLFCYCFVIYFISYLLELLIIHLIKLIFGEYSK